MSYWQDRMALSQSKLTNKSVKQIEKQLKKYYATAMKKTIADFEATYNRLLAATEEGRQPTPADLYKLDKYWQAQAQMRLELQKLGDRQITALSKAFEENFFEIYYSIGLQGLEAFSTIDVSMVQQLINHIWVADGKSWSQRIWENNELLAATLNEELVNCVVAGKKTTDLKNMLQERFNVGYGRADALVRTELAHIQTQAAQKRYEDYGIQEMEIWADEDERRCDVCGKLHQKRYPIGAVPPIPAHPRCRCCLVPVVEVE
jgi:SPP1 gp7 family putative phage head morphogenesis protein